jgi:hypothetical protein
MDRKTLEKLAWRKKHKDFKSKWNNGNANVLVFVPGVGTCSMPLSSLSEAQLKEIAGIREEA